MVGILKKHFICAQGMGARALCHAFMRESIDLDMALLPQEFSQDGGVIFGLLDTW